MTLGRHLKLFIASLMMYWGLTACAVNPVSGNVDFVLMSEQQEINLGRNYHQQLLQQYRIYDDSQLQAYVNRLGQQLAAKSHRDNLEFHFTVLDSPDVNAFALPGGYVYITRGIMAYLNSEAELAGVLGHEIGHVTARHGVRQQSQTVATGLLASIFAAKTGVGSDNLINALGEAMVRGYGREHELESDRLGAQYLARVGYDPEQMLAVIGVLKNQEDYAKQMAAAQGREARAYHGVFATHPDNDQRLKTVIKAAQKYRGETLLGSNRDVYLKKTDGMVFGSSAEDGIVRGQNFYHRELGIALSVPKPWRIENLPDRLMLLPKTNDALLQISIEPKTEDQTAREFLLQRLGSRNFSKQKQLKAGRLKGYSVVALGKTPWGEGPVRYAVWFKGDQAFVFAGAVKAIDKFSNIDKQLLMMINSFRDMNNKEKILAEPFRIKLIESNKQSFEKIVSSKKTLVDTRQLRLLNGQYPSGRAPSSIKIVQ